VLPKIAGGRMAKATAAQTAPSIRQRSITLALTTRSRLSNEGLARWGCWRTGPAGVHAGPEGPASCTSQPTRRALPPSPPVP
jgi:hypothetical protein